jgi:hypothetical protein
MGVLGLLTAHLPPLKGTRKTLPVAAAVAADEPLPAMTLKHNLSAAARAKLDAVVNGSGRLIGEKRELI